MTSDLARLLERAADMLSHLTEGFNEDDFDRVESDQIIAELDAARREMKPPVSAAHLDMMDVMGTVNRIYQQGMKK